MRKLNGLVALVLLTFAAGAQGAVVTASGSVEGKDVSASATYEVVNGALVITLTHTGTRNDYTPAQVLTNFSFNIAGDQPITFDLNASSVVVANGSTLLGSAAGVTDVSAEWGLTTDMALMNNGTSVSREFSVTSSSLGNANDNLFGSGDLGGGNKLGGSDFGLINDASKNNNGLASGNKNRITDSVLITLVIGSGVFYTSDIIDVVFSFGSAHATLLTELPPDCPPPPVVGIPTPAALPAGLVALGLMMVRRRR